MFVITGGGSGIGRALSHALAARKQPVFVVGRRENALQETASFSPLISYCCADISTAQGRSKIAEHLQNIPSLDGLIHNAGLIEPMLPLADMTETGWQQIMATNVNAPLFLSQLLLPKLQQGRVLHIGSGAVYFPAKGWGAYCVSKAAIAMLTRCWQLESSNTLFANVMPGIVATDMVSLIQNVDFMDGERQTFFKKLQQENRLVTPQTVAAFLSWLLLDATKEQFIAQEWDMYDTSHHHYWLQSPNNVPPLE